MYIAYMFTTLHVHKNGFLLIKMSRIIQDVKKDLKTLLLEQIRKLCVYLSRIRIMDINLKPYSNIKIKKNS